MDEIMNIQNIKGVRGYLGADGAAFLNLEDSARGLGFTQEKNGVEYVKWERVETYLEELGFPHKWGKGDFIPENIFYRLAMKAKNAAAEAFQAMIADEVLPSIRKHGAYMTPKTIEKVLSDPDTIIRIATTLKEERQKRTALEAENRSLHDTVSVQNQQIAELTPKASYYDLVLNCKDLTAISTIAKDYGWSAIKMNQYLHDKKVQYPMGKIWLLYQKYAEQGYTSTKTHSYPSNDGEIHCKVHTYWTQKGRLFIYDLLKTDGILPLIEQETT